jgi:hypothetical protein
MEQSVSAPVPTPVTEEELHLQKVLQARLAQSEFEFLPVAQFLCAHFGVSDVNMIRPFKNSVQAWQVMRRVNLGVEVGSVANPKPQVFSFDLSKSGEEQRIECRFNPTSPVCRFLTNPQIDPKLAFQHPYTKQPMPMDLSRVSVYNVACRNVWSSQPLNVAARLSWYHTGINKLQNAEEQDKLYEAAGGVRGAFMRIEPTKVDGQDVDSIPLASNNFGCLNEAFTATMALVDESNLMNGIIEIPPSVCIAARLPIYKGAPEPNVKYVDKCMEALEPQSQPPLRGDKEEVEGMEIDTEVDSNADTLAAADAAAKAASAARRANFIENWKAKWETDNAPVHRRTTHFIAIPLTHVLAWPFHSEDFANQFGFHPHMFRFLTPDTKQPVVLYFMIGNVDFNTLVAAFRKKWMGLVDVRPLASIGFDLVPETQGNLERIPRNPSPSPHGGEEKPTHAAGVTSLRAYVSYMAPPHLPPATRRMLAPTLCPGFPSAQVWAVDANAKQMLLDNQQLNAMRTK